MTWSQIQWKDGLTERVKPFRRSAALWLQQGLSPRRLALTLALGFAVGCIPVVGVPTLVCAALALMLGLNQPAIQAANYAVMPLQLLLIAPFVRFGGWLVASRHQQALQGSALLRAPGLHLISLHVVSQMGWLAGQALLAWVVLAVPVVLVLTFTLTLLLRRISTLATTEAGD